MPDRRVDYLKEDANPEGPTPAYRRWSRKKKAILGAAILAIPIVLLLIYLPVESSATEMTVYTSGDACASYPCPTSPAEFTVGDSRFAELTGAWSTNVSVGDIVVSVNDGPSSQPCGACDGSLYISDPGYDQGPSSGSFDLKAYGPFHISVIPLGGHVQVTTFQITIKSTIL
ncbi:MAG: hypothetical protein WB778_09840 [Thermoplasmata archaeon]